MTTHLGRRAEVSPGIVDAAEARPFRFEHLDALRALGATMVVATHAGFQTGRTLSGPFAATLSRLDFGVALFFILTGLLVYRPFVVAASRGLPAPRLARYLTRRGLRILPAYWLAIVLALLLLPQNRWAAPSTWLRHFTFVQIYGAGWQMHGLTQTWSLCTEVAFYVLLPVIAAVSLGKKWRPGRSALMLAAFPLVTILWFILIHATSLVDQSVAGQWLPAYLSWFSVGMLFAIAHTHLATMPYKQKNNLRALAGLASSPGACWVIAISLLAVATTPIAGPRSLEAVPTAGESIMKNLLYLGAGALIVLPAVFPTPESRRILRPLVSQPARWLGQISYGIFLYHLIVLELLVRVLDVKLFTGSWLELFTITWTITVAVASLSYVLLERPLLRRKPSLR
jgi:peptidoglycan/LPS O-acetylase OafA/YrhL